MFGDPGAREPREMFREEIGLTHRIERGSKPHHASHEGFACVAADGLEALFELTLDKVRDVEPSTSLGGLHGGECGAECGIGFGESARHVRRISSEGVAPRGGRATSIRRERNGVVEPAGLGQVANVLPGEPRVAAE